MAWDRRQLGAARGRKRQKGDLQVKAGGSGLWAGWLLSEQETTPLWPKKKKEKKSYLYRKQMVIACL